MYPPILPDRRRGGEDSDWEERQDKLARGYDGSPWLTSLVNFSGFLAAFAGSLAALFAIGNLDNGTAWVPYAVILAILAAAHVLLRAERYRRRARRAAALRRRAALSGRGAAGRGR